MSELDTFLNDCANGKLTGDPLLNHVKSMMTELRARRVKRPDLDPSAVTIRFLLHRVAQLECKLLAVERLLGDLGDVAQAASNR